MTSLYDYLNQVFDSGLIQKLGFVDQIYMLNSNTEIAFDELINDNNWCLEIIRTNLDFKSKNFKINKAYAYRFRHIVICWILGIGFMDFVAEEIKYNMIAQKAWQLSAFTHDYGWFCDEVFKEPEKDFLKSFGEYYLLRDDYNIPALYSLRDYMINNPNITPYTYDIIEKYYYDNIEFHKKNRINGNSEDKETCDHGIVGACLAFREYAEYIEHRESLEDGTSIKEINKIACMVTASHNIWGREQIRKENKLLSIMALVDTIECTKLFTYYDTANRSQALIKWKDLYSRIKLSVNFDSLTIDLSELSNYIDSLNHSKRFDEIKSKFNKYWKSLRTICDWTAFKVKIDENQFIVSYQ